MHDAEILDVKVVFQQGRYQRIRRWWRGMHPNKGVITRGWTGWETVEEKDLILPVHTFDVQGK
jgi:hypothetical protein